MDRRPGWQVLETAGEPLRQQTARSSRANLQSKDLVVGELEDVIHLDGATRELTCQPGAHPHYISGYERIERFKSVPVFCVHLLLPLLNCDATTMVSPLIMNYGIFGEA